MASRTFYYARVSSKEQNLDRQINAFKSLGADERDIITDRASGKDLDRTGYIALKNNILRPGDELVIFSLDRLSRNKENIKKELEFFKEHSIRVKILDLPTSLISVPVGQEWIIDMVNNILVEVLGSFAEAERRAIKKRQAEGIAAAKAKGKHLGRPRINKPPNWDMVIKEWRAGGITAVEAARILEISKSTFYRMNATWEDY